MKGEKLRKLRLLAALLAMVAVMVASTVSPAAADHWDWYEDDWGVCGWELTPLWPYWEYGCHDPGLFFSPLSFGVFDPWGFGALHHDDHHDDHEDDDNHDGHWDDDNHDDHW